MRKAFLLTAALLLSTTCTAASNNPTSSPDPKANATGEALYNLHCASCHDKGVAKAPDRPMLYFLSTSAIHQTLTQGAMRAQASALTDNQKILVAEFLTDRKLGSQRPSPSHLNALTMQNH